MKANKNYKDSVFTMYFREPRRLVEVYNAIEGTNLPLDTPVEINTLEDALYKDKINDISFVLNGEFVVLMEHQSTVNNNMPIRMLMYIARIYEKMIPSRDIYKAAMVKVPTPKFIVLYNGTERYPEHSELRLSDAFIVNNGAPALDVKVDVYNINYGKSKAVVEKSNSLQEYVTFIHYARTERAKGLPQEEAIAVAVKRCIADNVMKEFLSANGSEVVNMLFSEWNMEEALAVRHDEGVEEGRFLTLCELLKSGNLTLSEVLEKTGLDEAAFLAKRKELCPEYAS